MLGNLLAPFGRGLFVIFDNSQRNANNLSVLNDEIQKHESITLQNIKNFQITQQKTLLNSENSKIKKYDFLNHLLSIKIE
ncbi:MAG: hypothetical protein RCH30_2790 [Candidatus Phytoplasma australasiaticum]|nr:hypothetical protein EPWB_v2c3080 ['Echinacea purpurea' witches'-broom phytoplasma]WKV64155.1 MAG: hypothetical protein NCHU2022_c3100 [Candidatus Phytoplasma australasiaticum]WMW50167.1 MAG: hypothetical protein RCH30_2790 [Candidatus Phytoplasma australasiaticum]